MRPPPVLSYSAKNLPTALCDALGVNPVVWVDLGNAIEQLKALTETVRLTVVPRRLVPPRPAGEGPSATCLWYWMF